MQALAQATPVLGRAFRRAKAAIGDHHAKLKAAIADVRALQDSLEAIRREIASRTDTSRFQQATEKARARFELEKNVDSEINWILTQLAAAEADRRVAPMRYAQMRSDGSILEAACRVKLELAEAERKNISATVRQQIGDGFGSDDLESEPRVKRARREVEMWRGLLNQCVNERDALALWARVIRNLNE